MADKYQPLTVDLAGQVAIVTGASRGLGKAMADSSSPAVQPQRSLATCSKDRRARMAWSFRRTMNV